MGDIQITPYFLRSKATDVRTYRSEHDEVINNLKTLVNELNEAWKEDAQTAFVNKFESMQDTFTNFYEMMEGYAKLMDAADSSVRGVSDSLFT